MFILATDVSHELASLICFAEITIRKRQYIYITKNKKSDLKPTRRLSGM